MDVYASYNLRIGGEDSSVRAHVAASSGHVMMIPLCEHLHRGRDKDPWRRYRDKLERIATKLQQTEAASSGDGGGPDSADNGRAAGPLITLPGGGRRAMHHSLLEPFMTAAYGDAVNQEDLGTIVNACKEREGFLCEQAQEHEAARIAVQATVQDSADRPVGSRRHS